MKHKHPNCYRISEKLGVFSTSLMTHESKSMPIDLSRWSYKTNNLGQILGASIYDFNNVHQI